MPISADALLLGYEAHDSSLVDQTETANDNTNTTAEHIKDLQDASGDYLDEAAGDARYLQGNGFNFSGPVTNITVVNGLVTAAS